MPLPAVGERRPFECGLRLEGGPIFEGMGRVMGAGSKGHIQLLSQTRGEATTAERDRLQLAAHELVVRTMRLRFQETRPLMYETACLAIGRFPGLEGGDVGNYDILELANRHGLALGATHERATVAEASAEEARRLGIAPRMPVVRLDRVIYAEDGLPVEWRVGACHLATPDTPAS